MKSKRLTSSIVALVLVAVIALGYSEWARKASSPAPAASASVRLAPSAVALTSTKDLCARAADRCACAVEHGAQLLAACFPERAVQLMSLAPASCATAAFLGVHAEALAAIDQGAAATKSATSALQSEPNNRFARRALAIVALQAHDFATSDAALSKLIGEDGKDVDSLYYMALSQRYRDHYNAAREGFLAVLRLDAQHIDSRFNLVTLTAKAGADQEADHHYQELLQIAPVGDSRLISARSALRGADKGAAQTLPVMHQASPANAAASAPAAATAPSVAPSR